MFESTDYQVSVTRVLDETHVEVCVPIPEMTSDHSRWSALTELWGAGMLSRLMVIRLAALSPIEDPEAREARVDRLRELLPEGLNVLARTEGEERLPGGPWVGCLYLDQEGRGLPVNVQVLMPSPVRAPVL